jgi:DNA-binding transcriptional ArsR family regulator
VAKAVRVEAVQLKPAQQAALGALASGDATDLTRARYEELTGVSRSQAAYDLAELVEAGLLVRIGAGRSTRYRVAPSSDSGRRRWTDERIRAELSAFCSERATWPSAAEFRTADRSDLYVAASRYGGIGFWAAELGFPRSERVRVPLRRRAVLAIAAALVFALGAGAAALALRVHQRDAAPAPPANVVKGNAAVSYLDDVRSLRRARVAGVAAERVAASPEVALVLRASRGDSWISVRSATGRLLAERVLARGTQLRLSAAAFRVRLGAAANVDLATDGSRLHPLPSRAAVVVVTRRGTRVAEWAPAPVAAAPQLAASHVSPSPAPAPAQAPSPKPKPAKAASPPAPPAKVPKESSTGSSWPTPLPSP